MGGGLSRYDGGSVTGFAADQGFQDNSCLAIAQNRTGRLWMCGQNGGIISYNANEPDRSKRMFTRYASPQGFPDITGFSMISDKSGSLWFSADEGVSHFDGRTIVKYTPAQGLIAPSVVSLMEDGRGRMWIGTYEGGISRFDGKSFTNFTTKQGLVHNTVWCFYEDEKGNVWMATRGGLSLFDGKIFKNFTKAQGLTDNKLSYVTEDKNGNILIGSWGGGVSVIRKQMVDKLTSGENIPNGEAIFENFTTNEGLANDVVYSILEDEEGNIFIGTSLGFTVLRGGISILGECLAKDGIEYFNQKTGYPIKDIANNYSMYLDKKGVIWAGTGDKLLKFDYKKVRRNSSPLKVFIEAVQVNNEKISWHTLQQARTNSSEPTSKTYSVEPFVKNELSVFGRKLAEHERDTLIQRFGKVRFDGITRFNALPENLVLPYAFNNISFDFAAIETARPSMVQYQFMLKGYDKTWSPAGIKSTASFGNISEGSYTFMVKTRSPEGIWSEPVAFQFKVLPPFYRSWMAYLFYVLLLIMGIFAVDRFQRRRLIARERQRAMKLELVQAKEIEKAYTELKSTQAQLIQSEKMASLGELAAGIAHEIQNPLNFVNNFSEVSKELLGEVKDELAVGNALLANEILKDIQGNLEKINHHGKRADAIIKGMLQHSRRNTGSKEPTDINALVDEYFKLAFHGLRARDKSFNAFMETDLDESIGKINIIPQEIGRVVLNLITNAFYAVNERSKQSDAGYQPTVWLRTRQLNGQVKVEVADNGNGIPEKDKEKIFQPFLTTKPAGEGTGLGLSLSYDIVKGHGGELLLETKEGKGTTISIILPVN
jgi:signal transduction histidine kinase/streptogramin lyase